jgi:hypothetical protein
MISRVNCSISCWRITPSWRLVFRSQGMTLEDPPHESPRPPTLEASHLLTGPTGCPGFEVFRLLRTIRRRARHRVTICRLRHSDQINKSEHAGTDRVAFWQCLGAFACSAGSTPSLAQGHYHAGRSSGVTSMPSSTITFPSSFSVQLRRGISTWHGVSLVPPSSVFGPVENSTLP